jgi:hypothetical protein
MRRSSLDEAREPSQCDEFGHADAIEHSQLPLGTYFVLDARNQALSIFMARSAGLDHTCVSMNCTRVEHDMSRNARTGRRPGAQVEWRARLVSVRAKRIPEGRGRAKRIATGSSDPYIASNIEEPTWCVTSGSAASSSTSRI